MKITRKSVIKGCFVLNSFVVFFLIEHCIRTKDLYLRYTVKDANNEVPGTDDYTSL